MAEGIVRWKGNCEDCGALIESEFARPRQFCDGCRIARDRACSRRYDAKKRLQQTLRKMVNPELRRGPGTYSCPQCGAEFEKQTARLVKYCSRKCRIAADVAKQRRKHTAALLERMGGTDGLDARIRTLRRLTRDLGLVVDEPRVGWTAKKARTCIEKRLNFLIRVKEAHNPEQPDDQ